MKYLIFCLVILLSSCSTKTVVSKNEDPKSVVVKYVNTKSGVDSIIAKKALKSFKDKYVDAKPHKAFAQSLSGAWVGDLI